jgi:hypothetical protein
MGRLKAAMDAGPVLARATAMAALVLVAAKAHGRQLRLERERHGIWSVDFRADNDPWVEALWRQDRRGFWGLFAALAAAAVGITLLGPLPDAAFVAGRLAWRLALAFSGCFVAMGLWSFARLLFRPGGDLAWRRNAILGSWLWWAGVAGLALAITWVF